MKSRTLVEVLLRQGELFTFSLKLHADDMTGASALIWCPAQLLAHADTDRPRANEAHASTRSFAAP